MDESEMPKAIPQIEVRNAIKIMAHILHATMTFVVK
jgi:hypothetical protein